MRKKNPTESDHKEMAELRKNVQVGALLVSRLGLSGAEASRHIGVSKSSFNRYLRQGLPDGELWPEGVKTDISVEIRYNQIAEKWKKQREIAKGWTGRNDQGRYLPGHPPKSTNRFAIQARADLEKLTPEAVKKFTRAFKALSPVDDPALVLQFSKELFDRVLGKPRPTADLSNSRDSWEEYGWIENIIMTGDERSLRLAAELAASMAHYYNPDGSPFVPPHVEIVPPLVRAVDNPSSDGDEDIPEADNQSSSIR